ncbi:ABC transporter substrate-binding protein [Paracraurococcus ruber]|uniref:ABC transporter permease n=1 Tax=Paracraurococcus ruber TaxID=77675 RepID=A0ABS1CRK7_9PROT|nr:ABC transporter substrate-binding protein [Paracraurococcus ruber]MBK1657083.1 ABC transporter permease [Paracraurococcus ruber]TDG33382.1 ABC transporter substrate-binding protein [Paracraurococcus ruber]
MNIARRALVLGAATLPTLARAQAQQTIRLGIISDMSGAFADLSGPNSVLAVRQAIQDAASLGLRVELVTADHQNKPDVAVNIARQWFDRDGVDALIDVPASSAALAANAVVREKNKVFLASAPGTAELTGAQCSPNTVQWTYDTWMLANSTARAMVREGGDSWFFVTADYAFGHSMEVEGAKIITAEGGRVLGNARFPFPGTTDFSAFLLRAQASRAKVVGLAFGGTDMANAVKQATEFGLQRRGQKLAALILFISEVHSMGLATAKGLVCSESFYWDLNDRTRALTARLKRNFNAPPPTMVQAGCYAATLHYLKTVADMGVAEAKRSGAATVARMKAMPCDDDAFGPGTIRADGRKLHPAYLLEVKAPEESRGPWDYYKVLATVPGDQAFRPMAEGGCPLV